MSDFVTEAGTLISVSKEVAEFFERDRKYMQAQEKRDARHLSKRDFETVLSCQCTNRYGLEDLALGNLQLKALRQAVLELNDEERMLISLRFDRELSMEQIGQLLGVSKMAISKRLKKLFAKLRDSVV